MSCRDIHATTALAFVVALLSLGALLTATLVPQWRVTSLSTFNKNAKNVTIYDGLWAKCVRQDGSSGCLIYDSEWYSKVDQLDLRVLQFALPVSIFFSSLSLLLGMTGMCKTTCCPGEADVNAERCLVNSVGCHLVAGVLYFLAGGVSMAPSVWFLFSTAELNQKFGPLFSVDFAVYVAIGGAGGLLLAALLLFLWYCMCKGLPSPLWLPLQSQPPVAHGFPPSGGYASPTYVPPQFAAQVPNQAYVHGYPPHMLALQEAPQQTSAPHTYMSQISAPEGYGSEASVPQSYARQSYASQSYGSPSYLSPRYSTRSRLSTIEIDIPVLSQER
ncbi:CLD12 protein, partial [Amia calva]|nr:CLD12 protein [Amia calva]